MKYTFKKNRHIQAAVIAVLTVGVNGTSTADPIFPPDHLHKDARFAAQVTSAERLTLPWYHTSDAKTREHLIAGEALARAPHPTRYYFDNVRMFGNPSTRRIRKFRSAEPASEVKIVDEVALSGGES